MTYRFNDQVFTRLPLLGERATREIFSDSFAAWAAVGCDGRQPFRVEQFAGTTPTDRSEFLRDVPNEAVISALTSQEWQRLPDHDLNDVALTLIWHNTATGEIFDVDMELHLGAGRFADCGKQACERGMVDLRNTVTHEAGHLLGLGHSSVAGSTMQPRTGGNGIAEVEKSTLESDDIAGYCALELPEWKCTGSNCMCPAPPIVPSKRVVRSCGCRSLGAGASARWTPALSLLLLAAAGRRRRRRASGRVSQPRSVS